MIAAGATATAASVPADHVRLFAQPSYQCEAPYLTVAELRSVEEFPCETTTIRPLLRGTGWAHVEGEMARAHRMLWFDTKDGLPVTLDASRPIEGVITLTSQHLDVYTSGGNQDLYVWVETAGLRFGGLASDPPLDPIRVTGNTQLPVHLTIPAVLDGLVVNDLRVGIEPAGSGWGMVGVRGQGATWFDLPLGDGTAAKQAAVCEEQADMTAASPVVDIAVDGVDQGVNPILFDRYVHEVTYDFRGHATAAGLVQVDLFGDWFTTAGVRRVGDLNMHVKGANSSVLQQPFEAGREYLSTVLPVCGTFELAITRPWPSVDAFTSVTFTFESGLTAPTWPWASA